jgi:Family of unknown function (DUF6807)
MEPLPRVEAIPLQSEGVSFRVAGEEVVRYNAGWDMHRPYLFPVLGPTGRMVTRMGHPHDPAGHRHHYSVWVAHHDVSGVDFWSDEPRAGRQVHRNTLALEDGRTSAAARVAVDWVGPDGAVLLTEERTYRLTPLADKERLIEVHLRLTPARTEVAFGATSFGLVAVRVAKTMTVADGGGQIVSSEGAFGEEAIFWQPAHWVDYSGPVARGIWEGLTLLSHPANLGHPPDWHVRSDGWMGPCLSREKPVRLDAEQSLELRYALYVHQGRANEVTQAAQYEAFAASEFRPCQR